jgi:DNA-binding CsgD family transcriptional regulator
MTAQPRDNTDRNRRVMARIAQGWTYGQIALAMGISRSTVAGVVSRNRDRVEDEAAPAASLPPQPWGAGA